MATHSSTLAWKIPWIEEPGKLQSHGVEKSRTRLSDFTFTFKEKILNTLLMKVTFFCCCSTTLLLPTHLPPPSGTHAQSYNPMDCSPPGSSDHGLFQARILEWVAISFSREANIFKV